MYRKALQKHPDSTAALKGLEDVANNVRESLRRLQAVQDEGEVYKDKAYWLKRVLEWRDAVENHAPGMLDAAAVTVGAWPAKDILTIHYLIIQKAGLSNLGPAYYEPYVFLNRELGDKGIEINDISSSINLEPDPEHLLKRAALLPNCSR